MKPKQLEVLRIFFTTAAAAFTVVENIQKIMNHKCSPNVLHVLNTLALNEVLKEKPNMLYIHNILFEMEQIAKENGKNDKIKN